MNAQDWLRKIPGSTYSRNLLDLKVCKTKVGLPTESRTFHRPTCRTTKRSDTHGGVLVVVVILWVDLMKLSELGSHRRVAFGEFLDRKVVCLVVG